MSDYKIIWKGRKPNKKLVKQTEDECGQLLENGLKCPKDLVCHVVLTLPAGEDGPIVNVSGGFDNNFHAKYNPNGRWVTLDTMKEDNQ